MLGLLLVPMHHQDESWPMWYPWGRPDERGCHRWGATANADAYNAAFAKMKKGSFDDKVVHVRERPDGLIELNPVKEKDENDIDHVRVPLSTARTA
jgi:hypothetical protein